VHRKILIEFAIVALVAGVCGSVLTRTSAPPVLSDLAVAQTTSMDAFLAGHESSLSRPALRVLTEPAAGIGPMPPGWAGGGDQLTDQDPVGPFRDVDYVAAEADQKGRVSSGNIG
jgi:hypothetical protein